MGWQVFEDFQAAPKGTEDFNMEAVKIGRELAKQSNKNLKISL